MPNSRREGERRPVGDQGSDPFCLGEGRATLVGVARDLDPRNCSFSLDPRTILWWQCCSPEPQHSVEPSYPS